MPERILVTVLVACRSRFVRVVYAGGSGASLPELWSEYMVGGAASTGLCAPVARLLLRVHYAGLECNNEALCAQAY